MVGVIYFVLLVDLLIYFLSDPAGSILVNWQLVASKQSSLDANCISLAYFLGRMWTEKPLQNTTLASQHVFPLIWPWAICQYAKGSLKTTVWEKGHWFNSTLAGWDIVHEKVLSTSDFLGSVSSTSDYLGWVSSTSDSLMGGGGGLIFLHWIPRCGCCQHQIPRGGCHQQQIPWGGCHQHQILSQGWVLLTSCFWECMSSTSEYQWWVL